MPYRTTPFVNGEFYHLYNRGLNKQPIFHNARDYSIFIQTFLYYAISNPKPKFSTHRKTKISPIDPNQKVVDIVGFCLMPNHFHLLVKQNKDGGISEFMRKFIHSYSKYRNTKYKLQGPLFPSMFKAVRVETDEQFIHLSRYIHLNPLVTLLVKDLRNYPWSSYQDFIGQTNNYLLAKQEILKFFKSPKEYEQFVLDQADYGQTLEQLKHLTVDDHK